MATSANNMEFGEKLKEMKMTTDEINRFTKAFKDPKFRELLQDYTKEISDPENKRKYEEEITLLELERGMVVHFIHPEPCRALQTTVDGKQKCFINICSNEYIGKPEFKAARSADGSPGQHWSLPHSVSPGRPEVDGKGNKFMIYDIIFHPDTLYIAEKNRRFMDMIDGLAIQAIQDGFNVKLDKKKNTRVLNIKYKGTPQAAVTRKPIPGYPEGEKPAQPDPLSFPYPDEKRPDPAPKANPQDDPKVEARPSQVQLNPAEGPTKPNYTLKYRELIDLQDFRHSRDSARSPRPKEVVMVVDLPLLRTVGDLDLEVNEKTVLLQSEKPRYRLEVPLAYPVDYHKGDAKFNVLTHQLTISLPVLPAKQQPPACLQFAPSASEEEEEEGEDGDRAEQLGDKSPDDHCAPVPADGAEAADTVGSDPASSLNEGSQRPGSALSDREEETGQPVGQAETADAPPESNGQTGMEQEEDKEESQPLSQTSSVVDEIRLTATGSSVEPLPVNGHYHQVTDRPGHAGGTEGQTGPEGVTEATERETGAIERETGTIESETGAAEGETGALREEAGGLLGETGATNGERSLEGETGSPDRGTEGKPTPAMVSRNALHVCEDVAVTLQEKEEEEEGGVDEDDLPSEQTFKQDCDRKQFGPAPAELREIREDGEEVIIRDHATSAGFTFNNSLLYELD